MSPSHSLTTHPLTATAAGEHLRRLRRQARLSQLELSLITGISQRHLSCVETGRAKPSPSTLHALLSALDAPLEQRNEIFLAAGFAPRYMASTPDAPAMAMVHDAIEHILQANNPAPALVIASNWDITFTTFGMPLDISVASLRIEHLIPADRQTWQVMTAAYAQWSAAAG